MWLRAERENAYEPIDRCINPLGDHGHPRGAGHFSTKFRSKNTLFHCKFPTKLPTNLVCAQNLRK